MVWFLWSAARAKIEIPPRRKKKRETDGGGGRQKSAPFSGQRPGRGVVVVVKNLLKAPHLVRRAPSSYRKGGEGDNQCKSNKLP
jgi:hypothetical protein